MFQTMALLADDTRTAVRGAQRRSTRSAPAGLPSRSRFGEGLRRDEFLAWFSSSLRRNSPGLAIIVHFFAKMNTIAHKTCDLVSVRVCRPVVLAEAPAWSASFRPEEVNGNRRWSTGMGSGSWGPQAHALAYRPLADEAAARNRAVDRRGSAATPVGEAARGARCEAALALVWWLR